MSCSTSCRIPVELRSQPTQIRFSTGKFGAALREVGPLIADLDPTLMELLDVALMQDEGFVVGQVPTAPSRAASS